MQPYVDTFTMLCWSELPLDVAAPYDASQWIGEFLLEMVSDRFRGRMATKVGGLNPASFEDLDALISRLEKSYSHELRFGLVICDGFLPPDTAMRTLQSGSSTQWICVDWQQWFKQRVDNRRLADLWSYLSHACRDYVHSPERSLIGIDQRVAEQMAREGRKLLQSYTEWLVQVVQDLWE
jgi:hypothetical protein